MRDGAVRAWEGPVGALQHGVFEPWPAEPIRYIAVGGMRRLAEHLAEQVGVRAAPERACLGVAMERDLGCTSCTHWQGLLYVHL